ncbi:MAG: hypothetical protein ACK526_20060 [Planctomyces sp.]
MIAEVKGFVYRKGITRTVHDDSGQITQPGTHITTDTILVIYVAMTESISTDQLYQTRLDPPTDAEGNLIPMEDWHGQPIHFHPPKGR